MGPARSVLSASDATFIHFKAFLPGVPKAFSGCRLPHPSLHHGIARLVGVDTAWALRRLAPAVSVKSRTPLRVYSSTWSSA